MTAEQFLKHLSRLVNISDDNSQDWRKRESNDETFLYVDITTQTICCFNNLK